MNLRVLYASMILLSSPALTGRSLQKSISIDYIEEQVNESLFTYRRDMVDGSLNEVWTINGKKVDKDVYESAILEAEMQERKRERAHEYAMRIARAEFNESAARSLYQRLIAFTLTALKELIGTFERYNLIPHLVTRTATIASREEFNRIAHEAIPLLQNLLEKDVTPVQTLQEAYEKYAQYPDCIRQCLYETIQHAISTVDDTKQLKELLTLIAECP